MRLIPEEGPRKIFQTMKAYLSLGQKQHPAADYALPWKEYIGNSLKISFHSANKARDIRLQTKKKKNLYKKKKNLLSIHIGRRSDLGFVCVNTIVCKIKNLISSDHQLMPPQQLMTWPVTDRKSVV